MTTIFAATPARPFALLAAPILLMSGTAAQAQEQDHIVVGAGVAVTPSYQGASDYRVLPVPVIDIKKGWFFANLRSGIGIAPIDTDHLTIGASAVFVQGYRRSDVPTGVDKLSDGLGARVFANIRGAGFVGTFGAVKLVTGGTNGVIADASVSYPVQISPRFSLTPSIGTTWANGDQNDGYFGVNAAESAASGLPQFSVGGGFKDVSGSLTAAYRLSERVTLTATGGATALIGDVADSPIVEEETRPFVIITASYRF